MKIEKNKKLAKYTTYGVGGLADFFIETKTEDDIIHAFDFARKKKIPCVIIGNGSNIIINDQGFRGLVIKNTSRNCNLNGQTVNCESGIMLSELLLLLKKQNLGGAEFLWGIPGTLGGAIVGNAGMNNKSISEIVKKIKILEKNGNIRNFGKEYFNFSYRNSDLKKSGEIILSCLMEFNGKYKDISKKDLKKRKSQPKGKSAGSVFKNPKEHYAGKLIEKVGLKGFKIGDAQVSDKHANFIINNGKAKAQDIISLIEKVQSEVMNKFGVQLEKEVRVLTEKGWE